MERSQHVLGAADVHGPCQFWVSVAVRRDDRRQVDDDFLAVNGPLNIAEIPDIAPGELDPAGERSRLLPITIQRYIERSHRVALSQEGLQSAGADVAERAGDQDSS